MKTLIEIQNLSFAELKASRDELVEDAKTGEHGEVAARYIQALTDAKMRDEKLSEQATTLANLNDSLGSKTQRIAALEAELAQASEASAKLQADLDAANESAAAANAKHSKERGEMRQQLMEQSRIAEAFEVEAKRNRGVLNECCKLMNDAVANQVMADIGK